jgi:hypothetical protein
MEGTESYGTVMPAGALARYDFFETRNAARILEATNPTAFSDVVDVLLTFKVEVTADITMPGGNESDTAGRLNRAFRAHGWAEGKYTVGISAELVLKAAGSPSKTVTSAIETSSYLIDNLKDRVALDTEWHAKDGNLDRDLAAYRALYDAGIIDVAVMVTMNRLSMWAWAKRLTPASRKFNTTTTTNLEKVTPRLQRGDAGGCPVLIVAVCDRTV